MNPLERWKASIAEIDQRMEEKALAARFSQELVSLLDEWEASGFATGVYRKVKEHVQKRPKMRYWEVIEIGNKAKNWMPEIERCQEELRR